MPTEGAIARGPNGERAVFQGGQWVVAPAQQSSGITATPLPRNPYDVAKDERDSARDSRTESYDRGDRQFDNAKKFRDEFRSLPSVSEYQIALGTFNSAMRTGNTSEGDQSLITAFARMMDPNSVVREGEFATAAGNESAFAQIRTKIAKEFGFGPGGRLTPEGRDRLREEMRNLVVNRFKAPYDRDRVQYQRYAQMEGVDPYLVVGEAAETGFDPKLLDPPEVVEQQQVATGNREIEKLPQAYQDAHYAYLSQNWGRIDAQDYARFRSSLDERYGQPPDPEAYASFAPRANELATQGGSPADLGAVPSPTSEQGWGESMLNQAAQTRTGAFLANMGNAGALGLPAYLSGNQNRLEDIRDINPGSSFLGEIVGGVTGTAGLSTGLTTLSSGLKASPSVARLLGNPTFANVGYGMTYGATQDENALRGAAIGAGAGLVGDKLGGYIGRQFPSVFNRSGVRAADESVPSVDDLKTQASGLYQRAEANGAIAEPESVNAMIARAASILRNEGMLSPKDRIIAGGDVSNAMRMLNDFADTPMTPTQAGAVRNTIGEGRTAMKDGVPDYNQRRIAGDMLNEFDEWAEPALPGVEDARKVAQRAILGREMERTNALVDPKAAQFSQSGEENAIRSLYRGLDTAEIKGRNAYPPELTEQIQTVSRGTPFTNAMQYLGKFAPTSAVSAIPSLMAGGLGGMAGGTTGLALGAGVAGTGLFGRAVSTHLTKRAAKEAELIARGGPEYDLLRKEARKIAEQYGGMWGSGLLAPTASARTR